MRESFTQFESKNLHSLLTAQYLALAVAGAISTIILLAWITPIGDILPQDWYLMKANTALGILCGVITLLLNNWPQSPLRQSLQYTLIGFIMVLSLSALIGHISGTAMWLDTFVGPDPYSDIPGRMSLQTSLFIFILGLTLAFDSKKKKPWRHFADTLCIGLSVIVLVVIAGYVFNATGLYGQSKLTVTSPHTLACMIILVFTLMVQRLESGLFSIFLGEGIGGKLARIVLPLILFIPFLFVGFGAYSNGASVISASHATVVVAMLTSVILILIVALLSNMVDDATTRLKDSEQQKHLLLNFAGEGICGLDIHGNIVSANPTAYSILGYNHGELINRNINTIVKNENILQDSFSGPSHYTDDRVFYRKDGSCFPVQFTRTCIKKDGEVSGMVLIFSDISERKKVERLKDEFVSTVSHELRTPLTSIKGSLSLVMDQRLGDIPDKAMNILKLAHSNSDRLETLINDLLDIGKIESPLSGVKRTAINVNTLIDKAIRANQGLAENNGVQITQCTFDEDVYILGDEIRLIQVISNLLSNAVKYSKKDGGVVIAGKKNDEDICISIIDNGTGIPIDFREKVFDKFTQADSSDTRRVGGTGLGLAISKEIISQHNGDIWFESEIGCGTTFYFSIPIANDLGTNL